MKRPAYKEKIQEIVISLKTISSGKNLTVQKLKRVVNLICNDLNDLSNKLSFTEMEWSPIAAEDRLLEEARLARRDLWLCERHMINRAHVEKQKIKILRQKILEIPKLRKEIRKLKKEIKILDKNKKVSA